MPGDKDVDDDRMPRAISTPTNYIKPVLEMLAVLDFTLSTLIVGSAGVHLKSPSGSHA